MKEHADYKPERKDETVASAFKKELRNAEKEAELMCDCCKKMHIYARHLDPAGRSWLRSNLFSTTAGNRPLKTYDCATKEWKNINSSVSKFDD